MDNTTAYLAVLARIMQEERAETTTGSWEHYESWYALVHTDLTTAQSLLLSRCARPAKKG